MYELHERIKATRIRKSLSQKTIAEKLGITQAGYSQIESGKYPNMKIETLVRICEILDVSPDYLLAFSDYENSELTRIDLFYKDATDFIIDLEEDEQIDESISIKITDKLRQLKLKYED